MAIISFGYLFATIRIDSKQKIFHFFGEPTINVISQKQTNALRTTIWNTKSVKEISIIVVAGVAAYVNIFIVEQSVSVKQISLPFAHQSL